MKFTAVCNACMQPFVLDLEPEDKPLLAQVTLEDPEGMLCRCPRLCGGRINLVPDPTIELMSKSLREPLHLTGKELYVAVHGLGLPDEVVRTVETVEAMLKAHKIVGVDLEAVNDAVFLHELKLESGVTIHLSAGARGAQVFKMTKEKS
jgi:hypothetical protein